MAMTEVEAAVEERAGLRVERDGHVVTLILSRPEAGNSIDPETASALRQTWDDIQHDEDVWVVIVTGAGDRFFCTGSDLKKTPPPPDSFAVSLFKPTAQ